MNESLHPSRHVSPTSCCSSDRFIRLAEYCLYIGSSLRHLDNQVTSLQFQHASSQAEAVQPCTSSTVSILANHVQRRGFKAGLQPCTSGTLFYPGDSSQPCKLSWQCPFSLALCENQHRGLPFAQQTASAAEQAIQLTALASISLYQTV